MLTSSLSVPSTATVSSVAPPVDTVDQAEDEGRSGNDRQDEHRQRSGPAAASAVLNVDVGGWRVDPDHVAHLVDNKYDECVDSFIN
jgi:hypothetical protein